MVSQEMNSNFVRLGLYVNSTLTWIGDAELGSVECTSIVVRRSERRWGGYWLYNILSFSSIRHIHKVILFSLDYVSTKKKY